MTREEEILNEATNYGYAVAGGSSIRPSISEAFKKGAKWADQHPQYFRGQTDEMMERESLFCDAWFKENKERPTYADAIAWAEKETIYKACEWLRMNMTDTFYMSTHGLQDLSKVDFVNKFYESMEE